MQSVICDVLVLVPTEEKEFWENFLRSKQVQVITGSRDSVVERYLSISNYDYVVRLTSDCPNVPPITINKLIFTAMHYDLDYLANSWEDFRTAIDGHDCEIMSRKALAWLRKMNLSISQQEHVTLAIRELRPENLKLGALISKEDLSHIKLCIDTQEEYDQATARYGSAAHKRNIATEKGILHYDY
jgi:spore coat polysaccharide biosynthesis protein SpsF (cytidylyltransferase family)